MQFKSKTRLKSCVWVINFVSGLALIGGSKLHFPCNILAVILSKIFVGNFRFVMKLTNYRSTCTTNGPRFLNSNSIIFSIAFLPANFKKKYFVAWKLARWRRSIIEKLYNRWLRLRTMLFPGRINIAWGPWYFGDYRNIFLPNVGEDHKKVLPSDAGPLGTLP